MLKKFNRWIKSIFLWSYLFIHGWIIKISISLYNTEEQILKADPNDLDEKNKKNHRMIHRNPVIEKMLQGQRDEQYVSDYYEILKKADKFLRNSSPEKIAMAADKYGMNYGQKDRWGRRYEHYGFYDPKHKHYGKTLKQAMVAEIEERKTKDDDYPLEFMFDNAPVLEGLAKVSEIKETKRDVSSTGFEALNEYEKAKQRKFPLKVVRQKEVINKIEQLTEYLHIKKIDSTHRILEFFIPKKYKIFELSEKSNIFTEIINIDQVWLTDEYGEKYGYKITNYKKRIDFDYRFEIIKFDGIKIKKL